MEEYKNMINKLDKNYVICQKNGIILDIEPCEFGILVIKYRDGQISSVEKQENIKY